MMSPASHLAPYPFHSLSQILQPRCLGRGQALRLAWSELAHGQLHGFWLDWAIFWILLGSGDWHFGLGECDAAKAYTGPSFSPL